jgi:hypothetical protein
MKSCAWVLALAAMTGSGASAQISSGALGDSDGGGLKHGRKVSFALKDGKKVNGTVVRSDKDAVYIRTAPGQVPRRLARADLPDQKISPAGPGEMGKPEIHRVEVLEGSRRTVTYIAPALSPGERDRLAELEAAENEVARHEDLAGLQQQVVNGERDLESNRQQAFSNFYKYSALSSLGFFPSTVITYPEFPLWGWVGAPYFYGPWSSPSLANGGYGGFGPPVFATVPGLTTTPAVSPAQAGSEGSPLKAAVLQQVLKQASPEAVARAKANLARARSNAVFEGGRMVAVRLDEGGEYKQGDRVRVTPKKGNAITGTVERSDGQRLMIRTQPNLPLTTIPWSNIEMVEPAAVQPADGK